MTLVHIIVASTRENRVGRIIGDWVLEAARAAGRFDVELIDLKEVGLPLFDEPNHPRLGQYQHDHTKRWSATVARADGFVFVTPEYNHSYPASLKNALDYLSNEWKYKPVGFVSYGGAAAGTRAITALEPVVNCFEMKPLLEAVAIPFVGTLIDAERRFTPSEPITKSAQTLIERLDYWIERQRPLYSR